MPASDSPTRALPTLHEFFAPGGILARSSLPYEYRPGQLEMAKAVERALADPDDVGGEVVEAERGEPLRDASIVLGALAGEHEQLLDAVAARRPTGAPGR